MKVAWLIDDDEEMTTAVGLMFKLLGYSTRSFLDAPTAANELLAGQRPDLILLDVNMPQVSGKDFLEFVRKSKELSGLPIIMLSSEFDDAKIKDYLDAGANGYVTKPVSMEELERAIEQTFSGRKPAAH